MNIKKLDTESYGSVEKYLDCLATVLDGLPNVSVVEYKGKNYYVSGDELATVIAEDIDGIIQPFALNYDDNNKLHLFVDEETKYEFNLGNEYPSVRKTIIESAEMEQLSTYKEEGRNRTVNHLFYDPQDLSSTILKYYTYDYKDKDGNDVIYQSSLVKPTEIVIEYYKKIFGKMHTKSIEFLQSNDDEYLRLLTMIGKSAICNITNPMKLSDFDNYIIPNQVYRHNEYDLINLFNGTDEHVNTLNDVAKTYNLHK